MIYYLDDVTWWMVTDIVRKQTYPNSLEFTKLHCKMHKFTTIIPDFFVILFVEISPLPHVQFG